MAEQKGNLMEGLMTATLQKEQEKKTEKPKYEFDRLRLYFGEKYKVNDFITIYQPTIQDMLDSGEKEVYGSMSPFLANSTTYRVSLWDAGIDWTTINDYQFFILTRSMINPETVKCIFGDLDITTLQLSEQDGQVVLKNENGDVVIDEGTYDHMTAYLRYMFNSFPKTEFAKGKSTKQSIILEEKMNRSHKKKDENESSLLSMISFCVNHPGFKYKKNELREVCLVEFMDSVQRLNIYESTSALYKGMYSGFMDTKKINKQDLNFMRDVSHN